MASTNPVHLALREPPYGAPCGAHHGTFASVATAVSCHRCLAAIKANPDIAPHVGHPSLITIDPPVADDPSVPRNTHLRTARTAA